MVQLPTHGAKGLLQDAKIDEHPARPKIVPFCVGQDPVVMPVKTLALTVIVCQKMRGREVGLNPYVIHRGIVAGRCCKHKSRLIQSQEV